jgi:hypothetical protein
MCTPWSIIRTSTVARRLSLGVAVGQCWPRPGYATRLAQGVQHASPRVCNTPRPGYATPIGQGVQHASPSLCSTPRPGYVIPLSRLSKRHTTRIGGPTACVPAQRGKQRAARQTGRRTTMTRMMMTRATPRRCRPFPHASPHSARPSCTAPPEVLARSRVRGTPITAHCIETAPPRRRNLPPAAVARRWLAQRANRHLGFRS